MRNLVIEYLKHKCWSSESIARLGDAEIDSISKSTDFGLWKIYYK
jgi:hypothetical protein